MAEMNLDKWRLFADLAADDVTTLLSVCEERLLVAGEDLFVENDPGDGLFILQSGRVEIYKVIRGDVDRVLASLGSGDVVGEMSFIDGSRRSAGARTTEASEFLVLTRSAFASLQKEHPAIAAGFFRNLAAVVASRLRTTNELYRESVAFNLEATGTRSLHLETLADDLRAVTVHLSGGVAIHGRILQMDQQPAGYTLILKDRSERITIVPYHAIQRIEL